MVINRICLEKNTQLWCSVPHAVCNLNKIIQLV
jgi:hypothetical protein